MIKRISFKQGVNRTSKKKKKKNKVSKYLEAKKDIKRFDTLIVKHDGEAEQGTRELAALLCYTLLDNKTETIMNANQHITGLEFKSHLEKDIEKRRPKKKERDDLLVTTPFMRAVLPVHKGMSKQERQLYWNRRTDMGYSILYVLYNPDEWDAEKYCDHVLEHGYSSLAKKGREIHGDIAEQDVDEEQDDDIDVLKGKASPGRKKRGKPQLAGKLPSINEDEDSEDNDDSESDEPVGDDDDNSSGSHSAEEANKRKASKNSRYSNYEKQAAFKDWVADQKPLVPIPPDSLEESFVEDKDAVKLTITAHRMEDEEDKIYTFGIPVPFPEELDKIMMRLCKEYLKRRAKQSKLRKKKKKKSNRS